MNLQRIVGAYGTAEFEPILFDELSSHLMHLPLNSVCRHGGFPTDAEAYEIYSEDHDPDNIYVTVHMSVTETANTSCGDVCVDFVHHATINLTICRDATDFEAELEDEGDFEPEF